MSSRVFPPLHSTASCFDYDIRPCKGYYLACVLFRLAHNHKVIIAVTLRLHLGIWPSSKSSKMADWVRWIRRTTTYLGVAVIALIWVGIYLLTTNEHERAYRNALRQGNNSRGFSRIHKFAVFQQSDSALLALGRSYQKDPDHFDIARWAARTQTHKSPLSNTELRVLMVS